jgi:hypothetical protein
MTSPAPYITRIVTVYRQWELLREWVGNERLSQPEAKWVIVNDSPGYEAPNDVLAALYALGAEMITPSFNGGRSAARNLGASLVTTPYLEHVDGDDIPLPLHAGTLSLLGIGSADIVFSPVVEWPEGTPVPDLNKEHQGSVDTAWGALFPGLRPLDVRPAATLWRTSVFRALGGYDARFESGEDLQLAWKGVHSGGIVELATCAKQIYRAKPKRWLGDSMYCRGHVAFLEWLITEDKATGGQVDEWYPRLLSQNAWHHVSKLLRERRALCGYMARNLHKLRPW